MFVSSPPPSATVLQGLFFLKPTARCVRLQLKEWHLSKQNQRKVKPHLWWLNATECVFDACNSQKTLTGCHSEVLWASATVQRDFDGLTSERVPVSLIKFGLYRNIQKRPTSFSKSRAYDNVIIAYCMYTLLGRLTINTGTQYAFWKLYNNYITLIVSCYKMVYYLRFDTKSPQVLKFLFSRAHTTYLYHISFQV